MSNRYLRTGVAEADSGLDESIRSGRTGKHILQNQ
jgi:hypothetical protein